MKRALVLALGLVLLVGLTGLALTKSDYRVYFTTESGTCIWGLKATGIVDLVNGAAFDNYTAADTLTITEAKIALVGATTFTGALTNYGSAQVFGYDSGAYTQFAVSDTTGNLAITHAGSTKNVDWTTTGAVALTWPTTTLTAATSFTSYTPSFVVGYDAGASMTVAVSDTTGNVAITHAGTTKAITWTAAGGFDFVGAFAADALTLSDVLTFSDSGTIDNTAADTLTISETNIALSGEGSVTGDFDIKGGDIKCTTAGAGIDFNPTMAAAGTGTNVVQITTTQPTHASGTPTDIWLDFNPTFGINTVSATANLIDMTFTSPAWATGGATSVLRGIYIAPTIGNASAGTNSVSLIDVAAITGDAQVSLTAISIGALTGTGATENAISFGAGWDAELKLGNGATIANGAAATLTITEDNIDLVGALAADAVTVSDVLTFSDNGTIDNTAADTLTITETNISLAGAVTSTGNVTVSTGIVYDGTADGTVASGKGTAVDALSGVHQLTYTFTMTGDNDVDVLDGGKTTGVKVYDFPQGRIAIIGAVINASITTNDAYNAHANDDYYVSLGSADGTQAADADLTGTEQDIIPKTTIATDTAGANTKLTSDWHGQMTTFDTNNILDGTTTAGALYVNVAVPDAANTKASTHAITGTVTITYVNLGDY